MEGVLEEFGLADILQLIYFQKKTGVLNVFGAKDSVRITLIDGNIAGVESKKKLGDLKLGRILVKKGLITTDNLNVALEIQKEESSTEEKLFLGKILLRRNLVSEDIIHKAITERITEIIAHIFAWKEGRYEFVAREILQDTELPVSIDTQHLLMDGLRTVDEWSLIEGKLDLDTVFELKREPEPDEVDEAEMSVFNLVDGISDVSTIISVSPAGDFETSNALISLEEKGVIAPTALDFYKTVKEEDEVVKVTLSEKPFVIAIAVIALFIMIVSLKGGLDTFMALRHVRTVAKIENLKTRVAVYKALNGRYPEKLALIADDDDNWGNPYIYRITDGGFRLFSKGPDAIEGTDDDLY